MNFFKNHYCYLNLYFYCINKFIYSFNSLFNSFIFYLFLYFFQTAHLYRPDFRRSLVSGLPTSKRTAFGGGARAGDRAYAKFLEHPQARATKRANQPREVNHVLCRQKTRSFQISQFAKLLEGPEKKLRKKLGISLLPGPTLLTVYPVSTTFSQLREARWDK